MSIRITVCAACLLIISGAAAHSAAAADRHVAVSVVAADTGSVKPCPPIAAEVLKTGKQIFTGAGNCYACHGPDAKGTPLAPDLSDKKWLNIDGSYEAIVALIHTGVPKPKEHPAPMPPMGGAKLTDAQVCAVGAYVYTLGHKDKPSS